MKFFEKTSSLIITLGFLLLYLSSFSQTTGSIRGRITTSDGQPAAAVSVTLTGTTRGAIADKNGVFEIKSLPAGSYTLATSFLGLVRQQVTVEVSEKKVSEVALVLTENREQLEAVLVLAHKSKTASEYVSKMPLKNLENPQVYHIISSELIQQQAITTYDDALKNVPGIFRLWESTGRGGDGGSYFTLRGFETQVTMVNGLPGLSNGNLDPANLEKIEVLKGPSGTLFGSPVISYGGLVNNVTKKPYQHFGGAVSYTGGSFGLNRITADLNLPVTSDNTVLARVNTAYQSENSFQDQGFRKSFFLAPTLSYKVTDRLSFLVVTEFLQEEKTNPLMIFLGRDAPLQFTDLEDLNYNPSLSLTSNDLSIQNKRYNLQAQMRYKLSDSWTSQTVVSSGQTTANGYYTYLYDNEDGQRDFGLWGTKENSSTTTSDIQQNFVGDFNIGGFRNRMVAGLDYYSRNVSHSGTGWGRIHNVNLQGDINYRNPGGAIDLAPVYLTTPSVDSMLAGTGSGLSASKDHAYSAYLSDLFNITPNLMVMASLRVDHFDTKGDPSNAEDDYSQTALSPKFGLIYQPVPDKLSVFANYMNGFRNIAPSAVYDGQGNPTGAIRTFQPEHANQLEFGVKTNWAHDRLSATLSYYHIEVDNMVIPEGGLSFNSIQGGSARSKGVEVDIKSSPVTGLSIIAGYSYNDSKILKGQTDNVWLEEGRRPFWAGPMHLANLWTNYTVSSGRLSGWGLGFGGNYASENLILNNAAVGVFRLPSYTIVNGSLFYDASKFRISVHLNNMTGKTYYGGGWSTLNPQKPRNFVGSMVYRF